MGPSTREEPDEKSWAPGFGLVLCLRLEPWDPSEGHPLRTWHLADSETKVEKGQSGTLGKKKKKDRSCKWLE